MRQALPVTEEAAVEDTVAQLRRRSRPRSAGRADERALPVAMRSVELDAIIRRSRKRLLDVRHECLGGEACYPAAAINALDRVDGERQIGVDACPTASAKAREGWPPHSGAYTAIDKGLVSRLDHAAYLGRELTRAEQVPSTAPRRMEPPEAPEHARAAPDETASSPPLTPPPRRGEAQVGVKSASSVQSEVKIVLGLDLMTQPLYTASRF
jgi:hypothetical protein